MAVKFNPFTGNLDLTGSGGGAWGSITGTLSDQTDLQAGLDAKLNKSGDTMSGTLDMGSGLIQNVATLLGPSGADILVQGSNIDGPPAVGGTAGGAFLFGGSSGAGTEAAGGNVLIGGGQGDPAGTIGNVYLFNAYTGVTTQLDFSGVTANRVVTLPDSDVDLGNMVSPTSTNTLTNKRITPRVTTITSSATPTINTDNCDAVSITALAANITSFTTNLSGTPNDFDKLTIRIKDNGTARTLSWGASFASRGATLPVTTVISKLTTVGFLWNAAASVWDCVAVSQEA